MSRPRIDHFCYPKKLLGSWPWHLPGGELKVLSDWTINKTRERCSKEESQIILLSSQNWLPNIVPHSHCWKWVSTILLSHTQWKEGKYTKQWKPRVGTLGAFQILPTTPILILYKDFVLKTIETQDLICFQHIPNSSYHHWISFLDTN